MLPLHFDTKNKPLCIIAMYSIAVLILSLLSHNTWAESSDVSRSVVCNDTGLPMDPPVDDCINMEDADTLWRYIGISITGQCPLGLINWSSDNLFALDGHELPIGLARFCLFTANDPSQPVPGELEARVCTNANRGDNCLDALGTDSAAMAMMGSDMADLLWQPLRQQFLQQVGRVSSLPSAISNTRLTFIDTEPTGSNRDRTGPGVSQHGFTLLNLARDMICPAAGNCAVDLNSQLGLPMRRCANPIGYCIDPIVGGHAGTIGHLGVAIRTAVAEGNIGGFNRHVINLSVAWDPALSGNTMLGNSRVAAQAVYRALQFASCHGALVIAAAGNRITGPSLDTGPLLPAGWEVEAAPTQIECNDLGFSWPANAFNGQYRPLVHAVSAVDIKNLTAETRINGEPRLTAFGDHAVAPVEDILGPAPTQILTGTSVSAAVVSSAAAAAWYFRPGASAHQIMDAVYDSGADVSRTADFCISGPPCPMDVRRATICQAVNKACGDLPGADCPVFTCDELSSVVPAIPEAQIVHLFNTDPSVQTRSIAALDVPDPLNECRSGYVLHSNGVTNTVNPCPHLQYFGAQATPWTDGQPEDQFCPTCTETFHSPGKLYVDIDSTLMGTLKDITLLCGTDAYRIPGQLTANSKLLIQDIPEGCEFENVSLVYSLDDGQGTLASLGSPALLIPDRDDDDIQDGADNCVDDQNSNQLDTDSDGIGNVCDADFTNDCSTNFLDFFVLTQPPFPGTDPNLDLTGDVITNFLDLARFAELFGLSPGPSGVPNLCDSTP